MLHAGPCVIELIICEPTKTLWTMVWPRKYIHGIIVKHDTCRGVKIDGRVVIRQTKDKLSRKMESTVKETRMKPPKWRKNVIFDCRFRDII